MKKHFFSLHNKVLAHQSHNAHGVAPAAIAGLQHPLGDESEAPKSGAALALRAVKAKVRSKLHTTFPGIRG